MSGYTARLGNAAARLGRIVLGQAAVVPDTQADFLPLVVVEFSPTTGPMGVAAWVDITEHVLAFSTSRGRNDELDRVEAGTLSLTLANDTRLFDPLNTYSPWYGSIVPLKRIRIRAIWAGVDYPVFTGYVEEWSVPLWRHGRTVCQVKASDGFALLAEVKVTADLPQQTTSERIAEVLTLAGWSTGQAWVLGDPVYGVLGSTTYPAPLGQRSLSAGLTTMAGASIRNVAALQHIRLAEVSEQGLAFISADGTVTFQNRHERVRPKALAATFGTDQNVGELPYADAAIDTGGDALRNHVSVTRIGGEAQEASDTASIEQYFTRSYALTGLPLLTDAEAASYAAWILAGHKDFTVRLAGLAFEPPAAPAALWPVALGLDLSDKVRVRYRPAVGSDLDRTCWIERVRHVFSAEDATWRTTWALTPADTITPWILGDPTWGVLGATTTPVY